MMQGGLSYFLVGAAGLLLLAAAWTDIRSRTIPNGLNAAIALLAIPWWWSAGWALWPEIAIQIGLAVIVFAIFAAAFAAGAMGGGDVKLITALALWLPLAPLARMLIIMAILGGLLTLAMLLRHRWQGAPGRPEIPYGVAIALAGLWVFTNDVLTISGT
jgi:prepilin peptidase CpaA